MRIIFLLFIVGWLLPSGEIDAQALTISLKKANIQEAFASIEKQADVKFFYRVELLKMAHKVTLQMTNASLRDVLDSCFKSQPLLFEIIDKTIVVKEKPLSVQTQNAPPLTSTEPIYVKGRVITAQGEPISGATITIKGSNIATASNDNGEFSIRADNTNAKFVVTSIGIDSVQVSLENRSDINVIVNRRVNALEEVQIIGYGQTTRRLNTGNVTTITSEEIEKQPVGHVLAALEGRVPGMVIAQNTGLPGSGFNVLIRGKGTILAGSSPLYIIDGVPYPDNRFITNNNYKGGVNGLSLLNLTEIERVEILKDADATAIYGSRGANGVVLITTKKGKPAEMTIEAGIYSGFGKVTTRPKLLNLQQYLQMRRESKRNDNSPIFPFDYDLNGVWDTTRYTNWSKELLGGTAHLTNTWASISAGSKAIRYTINGCYRSENTVMPASGSNRRYGLHFQLANADTAKRFNVELSASFQSGVDDLPATDLTFWLLQLKPNQPSSFLPDGSLNYNNNILNPYKLISEPYKMTMNSLGSQLKLSWTPVKGLDLSTSFGYNLQTLNDFLGSPAGPAPGSPSSASYAADRNQTLIIEPQLFYRLRTKRKSQLSVLVGTTYQKSMSSYQNLLATGFRNNALLSNPAAATALSMSADYINYKYLGSFSRISYNLANKYLLNLTGRVDGTTRFGPDKQFHPFGAIGVAWILSDERFMHNIKWIDFAKLRASYGTSGNSNIKDFTFLDSYAPFRTGYQGIPAQRPSRPFIADLGWELKRSAEVALELQLFKKQMELSVSAYCNQNSHQLLQMPVSTVTGFYMLTANFPTVVQNKGVELVVSFRPTRSRNFSWNINTNISFQHNQLSRFDEIENTDYWRTLTVGQPITSLQLFRSGGVDPQTGNYIILGRNGLPTTAPTQADKTVRVNVDPRSFGGVTNIFSYKNVSLDLTCMYVLRQNRNSYAVMETVEGLARWQKPGDITAIPKYTTNPPTSALVNSTAGYGNVSYFRIRNLSLIYDVPIGMLKRIPMHKLSFYLQGQNLFTFTAVKNYDPENLGSYAMPLLRMITFGIKVVL